MSSGAIIGNNWQETFYPPFDAFIVACRSAPEIINACFGADDRHPAMKKWLSDLARTDPDEVARRKLFSKQLKPLRDQFRDLPLSTERDIVSHPSGVARIE